MTIIEPIKDFQFKRSATLDDLIAKARKKHYSTFTLYDDHEFEDSLNEFEERILLNFPDPERIEWYDENMLIVLRPRPLTGSCS